MRGASLFEHQHTEISFSKKKLYIPAEDLGSRVGNWFSTGKVTLHSPLLEKEFLRKKKRNFLESKIFYRNCTTFSPKDLNTWKSEENLLFWKLRPKWGHQIISNFKFYQISDRSTFHWEPIFSLYILPRNKTNDQEQYEGRHVLLPIWTKSWITDT